jgi:ATP-dependent DNA helicase PIF1
MRQQEALDILKMGMNVFLTGAAGSGKTYLLNKYIQYLKDHCVNVAMTASTGIAATHLQGTTLHAWSGIGVKSNITDKDLEKLAEDKRIKRNYKKTKVLIIDEISMLHKHQLDMVDVIARYLNKTEQAFGGLQVVLCGDFFQLPPVSNDSLTDEKPFAFDGAVWSRANFHVCYLEEQHRQIDDPLCTVLNDIRNGVAGEHTKVPLRTRYKKEPHGSTKATKLYSRNMNVDTINACELAALPGKEHTFNMIAEGFSALTENLKKSCLAPEQLKLKIGAEVMFVKNDVKGAYVNGTRCVVIDFEKSPDAWPIVKTYRHHTMVVYPEEWKYEDHGFVRATIKQVPLRLAWAITIHKSQGMTLDAAEIDLGDAFEPGMGYVALSRVRSLNGLKLMNLNEMALKVNPHVLQQDHIFKENAIAAARYLQSLSKDKIIQSQQQTLLKRFNGSIDKTIRATVKNDKPKKIESYLVTMKMLKENLSITMTAEQRHLTASTILGHLEKLKSMKLIDHHLMQHLKNHLSIDEFDAIYAEFLQSPDGKLKPIYEKFNGKFSYEKIQIVRLFR